MRIRISTKGGRPAKEKIVERRIEEEQAKNIRPNDSPKITFGKYKGIEVKDIESDYLVWCSINLTSCPSYITDELKYRGYDSSSNPSWEENIH